MINLGILTFFSSINYGAFLQAYTLQEYLRKNYADVLNVEIINLNTKASQEVYLERIIFQDMRYREQVIAQYDLFLSARNKLLLSKDEFISDNIDDAKCYLQERYEIIVVGSDEVWRVDSIRSFPNVYWMNFTLKGTVYMAYAVSGRNDYQKLNAEMQQYIKSSVDRFAYIGTRDEITRKELLKISMWEIDRNCDPVFLMPELYIRTDIEKEKTKERYKLNNGKPVVSIMVTDKYIGFKLYRMLKNDNRVVNLYNVNEAVGESNLIDLSPFDWSDVIGISDLVITDYFHGVVFSIIHEVPFFAVEHSKKGRGKIENLLLENGMRNRFLYLDDYIEKQRLVMDLYTKARNEMKNCNKIMMKEIKEKEYQKSKGFFMKLKGFIDA